MLNEVTVERCQVADVLLTHSYHLPYDRKQVRKMQPYPPLGTLYAAAVLREQRYLGRRVRHHAVATRSQAFLTR